MAIVFVLAGVGFVLILAEMFVPGGVLGGFGAILLAAAVVVGYAQMGPFGGSLLLGAILLLSIAGFFVWMAVFPKTSVGRRLILSKNLDQGEDLAAPSFLAGRDGVAQSPLRPAGKALVDGRRIDVVTEGGFIEPGEAVTVVAVEGARILVRKKVGAPAKAE